MTGLISDGEAGSSVRSKLNALADAIGFANDPATTTGLTFGVMGGRVLFDANADINFYDAGTVTLFDDTKNIIYLCPDLGSTIADAVVVRDNNNDVTSDMPVGKFLLFYVDTVDGAITSISDKRTVTFTSFLGPKMLADFSFTKFNYDAEGGSTVQFKDGRMRTIAGVYRPNVFAIGVENDTTNYLEMDSTGHVSANSSGFTPGRFAMFSIDCSGQYAYLNQDMRGAFFWPGGATGSFTTADSTVTVVAGVITAIDPLL